MTRHALLDHLPFSLKHDYDTPIQKSTHYSTNSNLSEETITPLVLLERLFEPHPSVGPITTF